MNKWLRGIARKEFYRFVKWFNDKQGAYPLIIGGWAVDYYNDYYGSKDVDVIFEARRKYYEPGLNQFLSANGYRLTTKDWTTETFEKVIKHGKDTATIDIDAADMGRKNIFHHDKTKSLPYSLCRKYSVDVTLEKGEEKYQYRVPTLEMLLLFKMKAYLDRDFESQNPENIRSGMAEYYFSKRNKDGSDIIALLDSKHKGNNPKVDPKRLKSIAAKNQILPEIRIVLDKIMQTPASRNLYARLPDKERIALLNELLKNIK